MNHSIQTRLPIAAVATAALACSAVSGALVDMNFTPGDQVVCVGATVEIDLVLVSDGAAQPFDSLDALLGWDPALLVLLGTDDSSAEVDWFMAGFLPDPEGLNDDLGDGDAVFTALAPPGQEFLAPPAPDDLIVVTFQFEALAESALTELELVAQIGGLESRVLLAGLPVTGALGRPAAVTSVQSCPADCAVPCDGAVGIGDFLALIAEWGMAGTPCDINGDSTVDIHDFLGLIAAWGPCPGPQE